MTGCACGCGDSVSSPTARFLPGHNNRLRVRGWVEEDRGYETPCHIHAGALNDRGYGLVFGGTAHRRAWEAEHGPVPDGFQVDHLCRQRACVRLDHLEAVTIAENARRRDAARPSQDVTGVRALRDKARLTQAGLAEVLGCSRSLVGLWETGKVQITEEFQTRINDMAGAA